ncbi:MAG TPA: polymer-forming cytoskeletal protein [Methylomirabilota bacterium]|nr:polymer-forming cytoskeletal protein [Methylomirabilota bacterium]
MWGRKSKSTVKRSELTAFIDEGSEITGKYVFSGTAMLNGKFSGEIVTSDSLIIGEKGVINANIHAGSVVVGGEVVGNISAADRIELKETARVFGDIEASVVVVAEGVLFEGHCRMTKPAEPDHQVVPFKR